MYIVLIIAIGVCLLYVGHKIDKLRFAIVFNLDDIRNLLWDVKAKLSTTKRFSKESRDNTKKLLKKVDRILTKV